MPPAVGRAEQGPDQCVDLRILLAQLFGLYDSGADAGMMPPAKGLPDARQ